MDSTFRSPSSGTQSGDPFVIPDAYERGVYVDRARSPDGHPIIIAVHHRGHVLKRRTVRPGSNPFTICERLWEYLDRVDPTGCPDPADALPRSVLTLVSPSGRAIARAIADRLVLVVGALPWIGALTLILSPSVADAMPRWLPVLRL